jgi:hypothetical protein
MGLVNPQRRRLFFLPVLAGAAGLIAKPVLAQPGTARSTRVSDSGYRITPHIERFYRSAGKL